MSILTRLQSKFPSLSASHKVVFDSSLDRVAYKLWTEWADEMQGTAPSGVTLPSGIAVGMASMDMSRFTDSFDDGSMDPRWLPIRTDDNVVVREISGDIRLSGLNEGDLGGVVTSVPVLLAGRCSFGATFTNTNKYNAVGIAVARLMNGALTTDYYLYESYADMSVYPVAPDRVRILRNGEQIYFAEVASRRTNLYIQYDMGKIDFGGGYWIISPTYSENYALSSPVVYCYAFAKRQVGDNATTAAIHLARFYAWDRSKPGIGATHIIGEAARRPIDIVEIYQGNQVRLNAEFDKGIATGRWRSMALTTGDPIERTLSECSSDIGWSTGAGNIIDPSITDYASGTRALSAYGTAPVRFQASSLNAATGLEDDFGKTLSVAWERDVTGGSLVYAMDSSLVCDPSDALQVAGIVSAVPNDLSSCNLSVDITANTAHAAVLTIALQKLTNGLPQTGQYYSIIKNQTDGVVQVWRRVIRPDGLYHQSQRYIATWGGATGSLGISIADGTISFKEDGATIYSESYGLSSYNCYLYVWTYGYGSYVGAVTFDNFSGLTGYDFSTLALNDSVWDKTLGDSSCAVWQEKGKLVCDPVVEKVAGVVTTSAYDMTTAEISCDLIFNTCHATGISISVTRDTANPPTTVNYTYSLFFDKSDSKLRVWRRKTSNSERYVSGVLTTFTGRLSIKISDGTIYFYLDNNLVYSESYDIGVATYDCYLYLWSYGYGTDAGKAEFEQVRTSLNPIVTIAHELQLYYKPISPVSDVYVRLGNDASNYWEFRSSYVPMPLEALTWNYMSIPVLCYYSKTGSPTMSLLLNYFQLSVNGTVTQPFTDLLDRIRLFGADGTAWCITDALTYPEKLSNEVRHVLWRITPL